MKAELLILLCLTGVSCSQNNTHTKSKTDTDFIIAVDTSIQTNKTVFPQQNIPVDTVTNDGWIIHYKMIREKSNDLYIEWKKDSIKRTFKVEDVLDLNSYFIPEYVGENQTFLFFRHGCSSNCLGVLVLPKNSTDKVNDYFDVAAFDVSSNNILQGVETINTNNPLQFQLTLTNLRSKRKQLITFNNLCMAANEKERHCIDSTKITGSKIYIKAQLTSLKDHSTKVYEEKRLQLTK